MRKTNIYQNRNALIQQGTLLCSTPLMSPKGFNKALILITRHNMFGTTGILINSPTDNTVQMSGKYGSLNDISLNYGGPDDNLLSFIISIPTLPDENRNSLYWSRSKHDLSILVNFMQSDEVLIKAYTGSLNWFHGELADEIERGFWWSTNDYPTEQIFENETETWSKIAKELGGNFAPLIDADLPIYYN